MYKFCTILKKFERNIARFTESKVFTELSFR